MQRSNFDQYVLSREDIISKAVPWRYNIGDGAGVYFLIYQGHVVYVGKAAQIWSRLNSHKMPKDRLKQKHWDS